MSRGYLVPKDGPVFEGLWLGGQARAGEVVFNTSHQGYEEIATDPSYFGQIMTMTSSQQGNYGVSDQVWESSQLHIQGFLTLDMQRSQRDSSWLKRLTEAGVPVMTEVDTRRLVLYLREQGTSLGALLPADSEEIAKSEAKKLFAEFEDIEPDWVHRVSRKQKSVVAGDDPEGPRVAVLDFGSKENILRELKKRCRELVIFPSRSSADDILAEKPDRVMLTNGPGDPSKVEVAPDTVKALIGKVPIFGICMGHQILALACGAKTKPLKYGHRGSNHPIKDEILDRVYMTSQNHGYVVDRDSIPEGIKVTHVNLNDSSVAGFYDANRRLLSVQYHPESHPGPHEAEGLFDYFIERL